jgi:GGDEF domain-containing protein
MIMSVADRRAEALTARAEQIMKSFSVPVTLEQTPIQASIRIGIALYPQTANDMHTLLEQAQEAARRAKQHVGTRYLVCH